MPKKRPEKKVPQKQERELVTCEVFNGNHCSVCGGFFADGEDICAHGHQIGQKYEKPNM